MSLKDVNELKKFHPQILGNKKCCLCYHKRKRLNNKTLFRQFFYWFTKNTNSLTNAVKLKLLKSILHKCFNIGTLYLQDQNQPVCKLWNEIETRSKSQTEKEKERSKSQKVRNSTEGPELTKEEVNRVINNR